MSIKSAIREVVDAWPWWLVAIAFIAIAGVLWLLSRAMGEMGGVGLFSLISTIVIIPIAVATVFVSLRAADKVGGIPWGSIRTRITEDPMSAAIYATGRWVAIALIVAAAIR